MNDPGQHTLWSIPGDGVLARQGNLVLLSSIDDRGFAESLLELMSRTAGAGGDGRALADAIGAAVEGHQSWGGLQLGPAILAFGPSGAGLAFTVSGTAFVEITTAHGTHRLVAGHPSMLLRSVVAVPVQAVRGGLGGPEPGDRTDRFSRLDSGTLRAWGLSYHSSTPASRAGSVLAPPPSAPSPSAVPPLAATSPEVTPGAGQPVPSAPATPPPAVPAASAGPVAGPAPTAPGPPVSAAPPAPPPSPAEHPPFRAEPALSPGETPPFSAEPPPFQAEPPPSRAEPAPPPTGPPPGFGPPGPAGPPPEEPPLFQPGPAEYLYQQPAPAAAQPVEPDQPFEPEPWAHHDEEQGFAEPVPGEPGAGGPELGLAVLQELGIEEPGVAAPPSAALTALGPPAPPAAPPPAAPDDTGTGDEESHGAPIVFGVHCKNGHFTDPDARSCLFCGGAISRRSATPQRGPRPKLGALILDDGAAVDVDSDYIIGRDPARDPSVPAGEARPLRVVDAESTVSRVHARVHLDGWKVLLTDLGSANGTRVQPPGSKAETLLEPRAPVPLQHGTRISVGAPCLRYERPLPRQ